MNAATALDTSTAEYAREFHAGWGDMDFNAHLRNTAYLDKSGDTRLSFMADHGFPMSEFMRLKLGPVVQKDELEYFREIHLLGRMKVTLQLAGLAADGSRFIMVNEFFREDGKLAARVASTGGWLDLAGRKLVAPPEALHAALNTLPRTANFVALPSSVAR